MTAVEPTPAAWRVAALATLAGGGALGWLASRSGWFRTIATVAPAVVAAYVGPLMAASRRPPIPPEAQPVDPATPPPTLSVVVAARDEAPVIERLIGDLAAQDYRSAEGRRLFELILVDDRSVDGTGQVALRAAADAGIGDILRFIPRASGDDVADGKSAALTAAPPDLCHGDVVVVLDADARIGPSFLRRLSTYVAAGADAVTARRRIDHAGTSDLAGAQADEQTVDGLIQRGRWALGGCSEFRGNGITIRRDLLAAVGGWRAEALTEDLDLSSRVAARGITVAWAIDAEVWEEPVETLPDLWRQRVRWAEGAVRRALEHGPAVVTSPTLSPFARFDFATYVGQLAIPPVIVGALAGAFVGRRPGALLVLLGAYGASAVILAWDALRWETSADGGPLVAGERARRSLRAALFGGIWLAAVPAAMWRLVARRGAVRYDKMAHGRMGDR